MQEPANANRGIAVANDAVNSAQRLHQEPEGYGSELCMKVGDHRDQLLARVHTVDDERHFGFETIEETLHARTQRFDAVGDCPGLGNNSLSGMCKLGLSRRPTVKQQKTKLLLQGVDWHS